MPKNICITTGYKHLDIDTYASCIAYRELLKAMGKESYAVSTAPLNGSVSDLIKQIPLGFDKYQQTQNDRFIILDVSDSSYFDKLVCHENIIEVIDHHTGFEEYWAKKSEIKTQIEKIGSVATIIYEKYVEAERKELLTPDLCKLMIAAIIDNTLNCGASITTDRDIKAYKELLQIGDLDGNWVQKYMESCEQVIISNLEGAIKNDTKQMNPDKLPLKFAQITIYNHEKVLSEFEIIKEFFHGENDWALNLISLKDGKSYLITDKAVSQEKLTKLLEKEFNDDIMVLEKFMLRKEIMAKC